MKSSLNRHLLANSIAGLLLGLGASVILTLYGRVGWSTVTPNLVIVGGLLLGVAVGLLPVRTTRAPTGRR